MDNLGRKHVDSTVERVTQNFLLRITTGDRKMTQADKDVADLLRRIEVYRQSLRRVTANNAQSPA